MKKMIWVLAIATLLLVSAGFVITNPVWKKEQKPQANIPVDTARLRADVVRLTSTSQPRSYDHPEALREAAAYIAREWTAAGLTPEIQPFKAAGQTYTNVIARYGPNGAPRLVVGAHYDVCEHLPGADDNARGVAGILELARLLQQLKPTLDYQVELVAYCLEEPPFFRTDAMGSAVHAKSLKADSVEVLGMVVLAMIG
ncbi:MAG: M28 family peptidase, partial [Bacteroidota bacterium]